MTSKPRPSPRHIFGGWHADVVECNVAVTVWSVVEAHDRQHAVDLDARRIVRDEYDRLLLVHIGVVGVRLAHDDVDLTSWVAERPRTTTWLH